MDKNYIKSLLKEAIVALDEEDKNTITIETNIRDRIIEVAKSHIGKPYVWGADGPDTFDCSGFTQYVYKEVGLIPKNNPDTYSGGQRKWGKETKNPRPGDLICYDGHVAIYLNENQIIHASSSKGQIIIANKLKMPVICYRNLIGD